MLPPVTQCFLYLCGTVVQVWNKSKYGLPGLSNEAVVLSLPFGSLKGWTYSNQLDGPPLVHRQGCPLGMRGPSVPAAHRDIGFFLPWGLSSSSQASADRGEDMEPSSEQ